MKRTSFLLFLCVFLISVCALPVGAQTAPPYAVDDGNLLTTDELEELEDAARAVSEASDCLFSVATYRSVGYYDRYIGEDFVDDYNLSYSDDVVLLIITYDGIAYYYDLYLYGDAERRITDAEEDVILDHTSVYPALKSGKTLAGAKGFLSVASETYCNEPMKESPYLSALPAAIVIAVVIAVAACAGVVAKYRMKRRSVDYPLDRFARLELTEQSDVFVGSFVTRRVISSGSGGGGGGGRGGGRGHAGGR